MPLQTVEELRYVKKQLKKKYSLYNEAVVAAEYVQIQKKGSSKKRLLVVGKHRLFTFRKARLQSDMVTDNHWYDLIEFNYESKSRLILHFRKGKQAVTILDITSFHMESIVESICESYHLVTIGYNEALCCKFQFHADYSPPNLSRITKSVTAGGIINGYEAQCSYFQSYFCIDLVRLLEHIIRQGSFDLNLSDCPLVEDPKVMLPLVGALRHNMFFLSLELTECQGNQEVLLMIANVIRFNTTLTKLVLAKLDSPGSFDVVGRSLKDNIDHAIQVIDISSNKIPSRAMVSFGEAFSEYKHGLIGLSLRNCQLSLKSFQILFASFRRNYGMSLTIEVLDISHNKLGTNGSVLLGNWMHTIREDSNLQYLYLRNTVLRFVNIGRALVHYQNLRALDISKNKMDIPSIQLLTLWIETEKSLESLNISECGIPGELIQKVLAAVLKNKFISNVKLHLDKNDIKKGDGNLIVDTLRRGSNIHTLTLSHNKFKPIEFIAILDALQHHTSLNTLVLDYSYKPTNDKGITEAVGTSLALLVNQNRNIKALSIAGTYKSIINSFFSKLSTSAALEELDISYNQIKDIGASIVTHSLRHNENLLYLNLNNNSISYTGWQAILQIFATNTKLQSIPYPWVDYQKIYSEVKQIPGEDLRTKKLLNDIQKMCSINYKRNNPDKYSDLHENYSLLSKTSIRKDIPTPNSVSPLAEVPDDIIDEDEDVFSFSGNLSDEGQTEIELQNLQNRKSVMYTSDSEEECFSNSEEEDAPPLPPREDDEDSFDSLSEVSDSPVIPKRPTSVPTGLFEINKPLPKSPLVEHGRQTMPIPKPPSTNPNPPDNPPILEKTIEEDNSKKERKKKKKKTKEKIDIPDASTLPPPPLPPSLPEMKTDPTKRKNSKTKKKSTKEQIKEARQSMPTSTVRKLTKEKQPERPQSDRYQADDCSSIGELLSRVMGTRREFIEKDDDISVDDDFSSEEDSW